MKELLLALFGERWEPFGQYKLVTEPPSLAKPGQVARMLDSSITPMEGEG